MNPDLRKWSSGPEKSCAHTDRDNMPQWVTKEHYGVLEIRDVRSRVKKKNSDGKSCWKLAQLSSFGLALIIAQTDSGRVRFHSRIMESDWDDDADSSRKKGITRNPRGPLRRA